jgi:hypothetical protein
MRMGVRDYLEKNQELNKTNFLAAVRKQLDYLRPAKRERQFHRTLAEFRATIEKILPLVRTAAAVNDPVPLTDSIRHLFRFLLQATRAADGVLLARRYADGNPPIDLCRAYGASGQPLDAPLVPFAQSLAGAVAGLQEPTAVSGIDQTLPSQGIVLQPFEKGRRHLLAAPLPVGEGRTVVLELFDKQPAGGGVAIPFTDEDRRLLAAATGLGADLIRQALAERESQAMLLDAVEAALKASDHMANGGRHEPLQAETPPPEPVLAQLRENLDRMNLHLVDSADAVRLAELVRVITLRHGPEATRYCVQLLEGVDRLLRHAIGE